MSERACLLLHKGKVGDVRPYCTYMPRNGTKKMWGARTAEVEPVWAKYFAPPSDEDEDEDKDEDSEDDGEGNGSEEVKRSRRKKE